MPDPADRRTGPRSYPADKARQGRIVLNTPLRKGIFIGGLVLVVLLVLFGALIL